MDVELEGGEAVGVGDELGGGVEVAGAQGVGELEGFFAGVAAGGGCGGEEGVGDLGHRGDDDDGVEAFAQAAGDDGGGAEDGGGVFDGGATELHDDDVLARCAHAVHQLLRTFRLTRWVGTRGSRTCP